MKDLSGGDNDKELVYGEVVLEILSEDFLGGYESYYGIFKLIVASSPQLFIICVETGGNWTLNYYY